MPDEEAVTDAAADTTSAADAGEAAKEGTDAGGESGDTDAAKSAADAKAADEAREPEERKRKTPADFIRERQERKAAKAAAATVADGSDNDGADDDGMTDADKETVGKVAGELVRPLIEKHLAAEDAQEVDEFLSKEGNEEFREYKTKAIKWMNHPSRRNLPVETVFLEVVGREGLLRIGAERARKADEKARGTQAGGGTSRGDVAKDPWQMTPAEFAAKQQEIRMKGAS